jgi:zinc protease
VHTLWRRDYPPHRLVVGLAGDIDVDALVDLVDALVDAAGAAAQTMTQAPPGGPPRYPARPRVRRVIRPREQGHIVLAHPGLTLDDPSLPALELLMAIVGGQTGRLFDALRERQGLVYQVSASSSEGVDAGHVVVYAATSQGNVERALAAIDTELARVVEHRVTPQELARAKAWLLGQFEASMQRRSRIASQMAFDEAYGLGHAAHRMWPDSIMSVQPADLQTLAARVFDPNHRVTAIVSA